MPATLGHKEKGNTVSLDLNDTYCKLSNLSGDDLVLVRPGQCYSGAGLIRALFGISDNEYTQLCAIVADHLESRASPVG